LERLPAFIVRVGIPVLGVAAVALLLLRGPLPFDLGGSSQARAGIPVVRTEEPYGPPAVDVRGTIVDLETGAPVPVARVAYGPYLRPTGPDGSFALGILPRTADLRIIAPGYRPYRGEPGEDVRLQPLTVKGVYLPMPVLGLEGTRDRILDLVRTTEVNALVIDVKGDTGGVHPAVATEESEPHVLDPGGDLEAFLTELKEAGVYTIARIVVFRDSARAEQRPELALRAASGGLYRDEQGQAWIDASKPDAWDYVLDIAERAARLGFDEVQFDYVRFPGDAGSLAYDEGAATPEARVAAIAGFLEAASARLWRLGVPLSIDTFGLTAVSTDEQGIGQRIEDLAPYIDYLSPMVYPSTWSEGWFGESYPAAAPAVVVRESVARAMERLASFPHLHVRPWLQDFHDYGAQGVDYGPAEVRAQIDAADAVQADGWLLWNPAGRYQEGALHPE
jgi:hypothetical protein